MESITASREWRKLAELGRAWQDRRVADAFRDDPSRAGALSLEAAGIFLDFSRQRLDCDVLDALVELSQARDFSGARAALWRGVKVNHTEQRQALHMALRGEPGDGIGDAESENFVAEERERMRALVERIRSGGRFDHVIHVGIGGSHLGPALAVDVLDAADSGGDRPKIHFVSTTDPAPLARLMKTLPRERTLLTLVSKSFTTVETTLNGRTLIDWLARGRDREAVLREQVIGVSANAAAMEDTGIAAENALRMPEWAGGRYSLWSAVGLPVALRFGMEAFEELLAGARTMDLHFRNAEPQRNLPLMLALVGVWNINFQGARAHAVLPYSEALAKLPAYLQQLEMESNGKRVDREGRVVDYHTAPVIWGGVGMNGQHAFFQQLHQGTGWTPMDFILVAGPDHGLKAQRDNVLANGLAQAEALMQGAGESGALSPYREFPGNRPSTTILVDELDARRLGALIALYEHKVFAQSVIWNLNPFDQFGVELGKKIAKRIEPLLARDVGAGSEIDPATEQLLGRVRRRKQD